jgi:hypothetical protein
VFFIPFSSPKQNERNIKNVIILDRLKPSIESSSRKKTERLTPIYPEATQNAGKNRANAKRMKNAKN